MVKLVARGYTTCADGVNFLCVFSFVKDHCFGVFQCARIVPSLAYLTPFIRRYLQQFLAGFDDQFTKVFDYARLHCKSRIV